VAELLLLKNASSAKNLAQKERNAMWICGEAMDSGKKEDS
jgi:hypothetical protein